MVLTIHGKGGHGHVVSSAARLCGWDVTFTDDAEGTKPDPLAPSIIAIGSNSSRKRCDVEGLVEDGIVHPQAFVERTARLGRGVFIGPSAVVHVGATVGRGSIINTGAIVEHDAVVGDWVHVAPGAVLCGGVRLGEGVLVGANATVQPGVHIAPWAVVGSGANVIDHITEPGCYAGNPAKRIS
jgi:sugar O-acyltransferase (sialic acid O-acetyltransferase NeuD family)